MISSSTQKEKKFSRNFLSANFRFFSLVFAGTNCPSNYPRNFRKFAQFTHWIIGFLNFFPDKFYLLDQNKYYFSMRTKLTQTLPREHLIINTKSDKKIILYEKNFFFFYIGCCVTLFLLLFYIECISVYQNAHIFVYWFPRFGALFVSGRLAGLIFKLVYRNFITVTLNY